MKPGDVVTTRVRFACPFCGGHAEAVDPPGVIHTLPPCQQFLDLEPDDYLHAVNLALAATRN